MRSPPRAPPRVHPCLLGLGDLVPVSPLREPLLKALNNRPKPRRQRLGEKGRIDQREVVLHDIAQPRFREGNEPVLFHPSATSARSAGFSVATIRSTLD